MATAYNVGFQSRYTPTRSKQMDVNLTPSWAPATLTTNDTFTFCFIPAFAMVVDVGLVLPQLDSNVSPTLLFDLGDSGSSTRYFSSITTGQAGGSISVATTVVPFRYSADDNLVLKVHTGAATLKSGVIYAYLSYTLDGFV